MHAHERRTCMHAHERRCVDLLEGGACTCCEPALQCDDSRIQGRCAQVGAMLTLLHIKLPFVALSLHLLAAAAL